MDLCPTLAALTTLCNKAIDHLATVVAPCRLLEVGNLKVVNTCDGQKPSGRQQCRLSVYNFKFVLVYETQEVYSSYTCGFNYYDVIVSNGEV